MVDANEHNIHNYGINMLSLFKQWANTCASIFPLEKKTDLTRNEMDQNIE